MILTYRRFRRTYLRRILWALAALFLLDVVRIISSRPYTLRSPLVEKRSTASPGANDTSVFIVSVHRNTEVIQRASWNEAVLSLVDYLGPENVHISAVESGSQEGTKDALIELQAGLDARGASNEISLGMTVWEQLDEIDTRPPPNAREPGWIWNAAEDQFEMRRIPYLSRVRNQAIAPLRRLEREGRRFDKVLWLNDVVFDAQDIQTLLDTRDGNYAAACSMDFKSSPLYYDTFALRDDMGQKTASLHWPWFRSPKARASLLRSEPIEVTSCWNGIVVFDAAPYYNNPPLLFRGIEDSLADFHLEGSECCLIHADNYLSSEKGVWLNPNVRVGYNVKAYNRVQGDRFPGPFWAIVGVWVNRIVSWRAGIQHSLEMRHVHKKIDSWTAETPQGELARFEPGEACLINEMQIMWSNGWKHL
ncbi:hypothetical protein JX265_005528 [Neoarthrinium moseri]|uniref:Polysaccharide export protein n=1 Tax=Neoarthrinium moseri TaxID=1658444 RepID=A0A9P9WP12_9PEZI|nr:uncharacterized protein JN550_012668 [Neoarthrinium moseri]KAI1847411.1 hypothetical protein JX266_006636 [Neoarthrinium moseri]KAI1858458.1 hypothetical protein JN550_012668 [Neoarthrinium moseri]KAI1872648.1 hypothetical protein JX265_005528 [Neoarthrinium moseri]